MYFIILFRRIGQKMARILVIEDEELVGFALHETLTSAGHDVFVVRNGEEGITKLNNDPVEILITDLIMPEKTGIEAIIETKKTNPSIKIIAISGGGRTRNFSFLQLAREYGADFALEKPIDDDRLLDTVSACLQDQA